MNNEYARAYLHISNNHTENKISVENIKKDCWRWRKLLLSLLQYADNSGQDNTGKQNPGREYDFEVDACILSHV